MEKSEIMGGGVKWGIVVQQLPCRCLSILTNIHSRFCSFSKNRSGQESLILGHFRPLYFTLGGFRLRFVCKSFLAFAYPLEKNMGFTKKAGSQRNQRTLIRLLGGIVLAIIIPCTLSGCSALSLHKSPPQEDMPRNPWIKPAKPEPQPNWFTSMFYREKKQPRSPSEWLDQKRPE
jgi:hypothetical protein